MEEDQLYCVISASLYTYILSTAWCLLCAVSFDIALLAGTSIISLSAALRST